MKPFRVSRAKMLTCQKSFARKPNRPAFRCTAAVFYPTWRTSRVHYTKGRPRAATSHESRPGKPSFCTSVVRTRPLVRCETDNSIENRARQALGILSYHSARDASQERSAKTTRQEAVGVTGVPTTTTGKNSIWPLGSCKPIPAPQRRQKDRPEPAAHHAPA